MTRSDEVVADEYNWYFDLSLMCEGNADVVAAPVAGEDDAERNVQALRLDGKNSAKDERSEVLHAEHDGDLLLVVGVRVANFLRCSTSILRSSCWTETAAAEAQTTKVQQRLQHHCEQCHTRALVEGRKQKRNEDKLAGEPNYRHCLGCVVACHAQPSSCVPLVTKSEPLPILPETFCFQVILQKRSLSKKVMYLQRLTHWI